MLFGSKTGFIIQVVTQHAHFPQANKICGTAPRIGVVSRYMHRLWMYGEKVDLFMYAFWTCLPSVGGKGPSFVGRRGKCC